MSLKRQLQKAETARRIFAAAVALFASQGYAATTVDQIVRAAGVAKGTFFTHFASKEALLDHIGALQMERILAAIEADPVFPTRPAGERLRLIVRAMAAGLSAQPAEMRALAIEIIARRSLFDVDRQNIGALDSLLERMVAEGQARGEIRPDAPAARIATIVRGAYFLALFEWVAQPEADLLALADHYLDLVLQGVRGPA